jgi:hypothetical protein
LLGASHQQHTMSSFPAQDKIAGFLTASQNDEISSTLRVVFGITEWSDSSLTSPSPRFHARAYQAAIKQFSPLERQSLPLSLRSALYAGATCSTVRQLKDADELVALSHKGPIHVLLEGSISGTYTCSSSYRSLDLTTLRSTDS